MTYMTFNLMRWGFLLVVAYAFGQILLDAMSGIGQAIETGSFELDLGWLEALDRGDGHDTDWDTEQLKRTFVGGCPGC